MRPADLLYGPGLHVVLALVSEFSRQLRLWSKQSKFHEDMQDQLHFLVAMYI